jgi:cytidylate kinase
MGTVVFPDAEIKFFLTADLKARAYRRYRELSGIKPQPLADVEMDMKRRDENDSNRQIAPLKPAKDAVLIDSSTISAEDVIEKMMTHIQEIFDRD